MQDFIYQSHPAHIIFRRGAASAIDAEIRRLGRRRALVLCTEAQQADAGEVLETLGGLGVGIFPGAVMHVPEECVDLAVQAVQDSGADCVVAFGGGSTVGLAKAMALRGGLPIIAVPTTYAGSEVTPIYGITSAGTKKTGRDNAVLPVSVIYDVNLTLDLPLQVSMNSGLNAIAHAVEALYAHDGNPVITLMAMAGIDALASSLPRIKNDLHDVDARATALYGAWLCGTVLGQVSMGLHHKLCHTLGGTFNLPHAETHAVMLPHVLAYNQAHASAAMQSIATALHADNAASGLYHLGISIGAPRTLCEIGMPESGLDLAADLAVKASYPNPRALEWDPIRALLQRAFDGAPPA